MAGNISGLWMKLNYEGLLTAMLIVGVLRCKNGNKTIPAQMNCCSTVAEMGVTIICKLYFPAYLLVNHYYNYYLSNYSRRIVLGSIAEGQHTEDISNRAEDHWEQFYD